MSALAQMMADCLLVRSDLSADMQARFDFIEMAALRHAAVLDRANPPADPRFDRDGEPREVWDANVVELHGHSRRVVDDAVALVEDMR